MLSNETAVGNYPVEAVETMARIAERIEGEHQRIAPDPNIKKWSIPNAISAAVGQIAEQLEAEAIMTLTKTGSTARNVSKFRPKTPILAITPHVHVSRRLQLVWGVKPLLVLDLPSTTQTFQAAINVAQEKHWLDAGDLVVMTAGTLQGVSGSTDLIKVELVQAVLGQGTGIGQAAVSGRARLANHPRDIKDFEQGEILVASSTNAEFVEIIRHASGIITEEDNLTSHAAILGLRLGIPVIVGFKQATNVIREGAIVTLDAKRGIVYSGTMSNTINNGSELKFPIP